MSRISDTRLRTRETASRLVAEGKRPHELTVDLIYAEIRQGSRTTINDELKQWKDEKTRSDALASQLPPAVADAMLGIWAVAVEHGEKVYDARVAELEHATAQAESRAAEALAACAAAEEALKLREVELAALSEQIAVLKPQLEAANARAEDARNRADALETQRNHERDSAETRLREQREEHEKAIGALRVSLEARDAAFQSELDKATQRMEGVQRHMMQQISEAREERKRADTLAASLQHRNETLLGELGAARAHETRQDDALREAQQANEASMRERGEWQREREVLENRLAAMRNRSRAKLKRAALAVPRGTRERPAEKE
ncbi:MULTISPECIES: DNA-binding protein [unclassified Paraburkholderia]|uniref:DNA-binding protein n=1 Tax=unclassified Paraburkholderia TaxID=2615204 RepID=UPI002AB2E09C|nr:MULTISPECIES: DNA-binding protein [unclassified Paraburkholderia]